MTASATGAQHGLTGHPRRRRTRRRSRVAPARRRLHDLEAFEVPARPRGELAVHPAAPAARPARRSAPFDGAVDVDDHRRRRGAGRPVDASDRRRDDARARRGRRARPTASAAQAWAARTDGHAGRRPGAVERRAARRSPSPARASAPPPAASPAARRTSAARRGDRGARRSAAPARSPTTSRSCVGDGARLDARRRSTSGPTTPCTSAHHHLAVGRDATLKHTAVTLGGDLVRVVRTVAYDGPGGDAELTGLYFADAGQHLEHRLLVDHAVPHCKSRVLYKGALQGDGTAHTVWIGDVLIRKAAEGTDTYEINRNLMLTDGARADSVPNLEIETGEIVGAGHASATGRFDDEQLFYLLSPGHPGGRRPAPGRARLLRRGRSHRHPPSASCASGSRRPSRPSSTSPASESRRLPTHHRDTLRSSTAHGHPGHPRPARLGRHRGRRQGDPARRRPDRPLRRDPRDHGPERVRASRRWRTRSPGTRSTRSPAAR